MQKLNVRSVSVASIQLGLLISLGALGAACDDWNWESNTVVNTFTGVRPECPAGLGGMSLSTGVDDNGNGVLDGSEISATSDTYCNFDVDGVSTITTYYKRDSYKGCDEESAYFVQVGTDLNGDGKLTLLDANSDPVTSVKDFLEKGFVANEVLEHHVFCTATPDRDGGELENELTPAVAPAAAPVGAGFELEGAGASGLDYTTEYHNGRLRKARFRVAAKPTL